MRSYYRNILLPAGTGFHFGAPIPPDLTSPRYLHAADPEEVICSVLAHAQRGNFAPCSRLIELLKQHDDADVWSSCSTLLSFAAPRSILLELLPLVERMRDEHQTDAPLQWAGETLARSCGLWSVPEVLRLFEQIQSYDRYMALPGYLSLLLEPEPDMIDAGPRRRRDPSDPDWYDPPPAWEVAEYTRMVRSRYEELQGLLPYEGSCVFGGEILSLRRIATQTITRINGPTEYSRHVESARMLLEAHTGEVFSDFYDPDRYSLRPLHATARLEAFLRSDTPDRFTPGVRCFFGHRIPT